MSSSLSSKSLLLIITSLTLILIQAPATFCQNNGSSPDEYVRCGESFSCANVEDIGYPFWGGSRPAYCGHPAFELNCRNEFPEIAIQSVQYRVFNINNHEQTANIARDDLLSNICPSHLQNASLDFNLFSYVPSGYQNITLYYGCTLTNRVSFDPTPNLFDCSADNPRTNCNSTFISEYCNEENSSFSCNSTIPLPPGLIPGNCSGDNPRANCSSTFIFNYCNKENSSFSCNSTTPLPFGLIPDNCSGDNPRTDCNIIFDDCSEGNTDFGCNRTTHAAFGSVPNIFNCSEGNSSLNGYGLRTSQVAAELLVNIMCGKHIFATVNQGSFEVLGKASQFSENLVRTSIASGFPVQWKANDKICKECMRSGGRCGSNGMNSTQFVCYCANETSSSTCTRAQNNHPNSYNNGTIESKKGLSTAVKISLVSMFGLLGVVVTSVLIICFLKRRSFWRRGDEKLENIEAFIRTNEFQATKLYTYSDIKKMTNSFNDKIGEGGFGSVYRGKLPDGCPVAVKLLTNTKGNGEDFINEVASICRTSHMNIVTLIGFSYQRKRALIYEFMPNGSLDKYIDNKDSPNKSCQLEWKTLYHIAIGIARGLEYLHGGCNTRIMHFDIKPNNILLDKDFTPKISDFGLAKLCKKKESIVSLSTFGRGTVGYIAPEVFFRSIGGVSHKSDVYSYGMTVIDMVGVRERADAGQTSDSCFTSWIYEHLEQGFDFSLQGITDEEDKEMAMKMILVSLWCIQTNPADRPSIRRVIEMLEGSIASLQIPPKPVFCPPTELPQLSSTSSVTTEI